MSRIEMAGLVSPDRIILALYAANKQQAVERLSRFVAASIGVDGDVLWQSVMAREDLTTFGVGRGVAIPHTIVGGIAAPVGALARLKQPIDFHASDGSLADLVFLLLVPDHRAGLLLPALSCVARRLRDPEVARRLRAESEAEAAHVILTVDSWRGEDQFSSAARGG